MSPLLYIETLAENLDTYLLLLILFAPLHYWLAKRLVRNLFDPLLMVILADWFGFTLVTFIWMNNDSRAEHFYYYAASQAAFYAGFLFIRGLNKLNRQPPIEPPFALVKWVLFFSTIVHLIAVAAKWGLTGIPLFKVSRLGAFAESGGFGIIERLETGSFLILAFAAFTMWIRFRSRARYTTLGILLWLLAYIALSGSKSALLGLMQIYFLLRYLWAENPPQSKFFGGQSGSKAFIIAAMFSLTVLIIQSQGNFNEALLGLAIRLVSFGDIYIYAYIDDTLTSIQGSNPFIGLFGGAMSTFRIIPIDWIYKNMGLQFSEIIFPTLDYLTGPNPRHNVFGFHYFGWSGIAFSALLGFFVSILQRRLYNRIHHSYFSVLWSFLFYFSLFSLSSDFDFAMSTLSSVLISSTIILIPAQFLYRTNLTSRKTFQHVSS